MKQTIFTTLLFFILAATQMMEAQRPVLIEHFTNTWCPICAGKNPTMYETLDKYPNQAVHIAYHIPVPYSQCIFYQANKSDQDARMSYYNVFSSPSAYLNGTTAGGGGKLLDESKLTAAIASDAPLSIDVMKAPASTPDGLGYRVDVNIVANNTVDAGNNARLFVMVAERNIDYSGPNGEEKHPDVFRKFLTAATGDPISLPTAGNNASMTYSYVIESGWVENQVYPIAFIQNEATKTVYAAGSSLLSSTSGAKEYAPTEALQVYPNPAYDQLFLNAPIGDPNARARIYTVSGQLIRTSQVNNQTIDLSGLTSGMYVVRIQDRVGRFVKY